MIPYFLLDIIHLGFFTIYVWGLFAGLAFVAALYIALKEANRKNISQDTILDLAILIMVGGVIGARLAYVIENWSDYSGNLTRIFQASEGGLMFYGGLAGAFLAAAAYIKFKKLAFWKISDALAPSLAIGEFIGRIGCALADLHIGSLTSLPWGQAYMDSSIRHPIGIYTALNGLVMFGVLWALRLRLKADGALFLFAILWYSGTRFFLDFLRCSDLAVCDPHYFGFTPSQYFSAALFLSILIIIIRDKKFIYPVRSYFAALNTARQNKFDGIIIKTTMETHKQDISNGVEAQKNQKFSQESSPAKESALTPKPEAIGTLMISKSRDAVRKHKKSGKIILVFLVGLAIGAGSFFGYYERLFKFPVFSFKGKTWVSYTDPIVKLTVVNDKNCAKCDTTDMVNQLKNNAIPTLIVSQINFDSAEGKALIAKFGIKSLPSLVFDSSIEKARIFQQISTVLIKKDSDYYVNPATSGIPQVKLLEKPSATSQDRVKGPADAPVTILEYSDFQCPYCKLAAETIKQVLAAYPDKVKLIYRNFPLTTVHADAQYAAEAAECAGDQAKFWEMSDALFAHQDKLDANSINNYARTLGLDAKKFGDCLSSGKFKTKIAADIKSANDYGISGTPSFFAGDQFVGASATLDDFKALIDQQLKNK